MRGEKSREIPAFRSLSKIVKVSSWSNGYLELIIHCIRYIVCQSIVRGVDKEEGNQREERGKKSERGCRDKILLPSLSKAVASAPKSRSSGMY